MIVIFFSANLRINGGSFGNHGSMYACEHVCAELCAGEDGY